MNKLSREEFYILTQHEQFKYINKLSNEYSHGDWLKYDKDNNEYIDVDCFEVIEDLYEYLNDVNCDYEGCDLYQKCFKE